VPTSRRWAKNAATAPSRSCATGASWSRCRLRCVLPERSIWPSVNGSRDRSLSTPTAVGWTGTRRGGSCDASRRAEIGKRVGPHTLRHALSPRRWTPAFFGDGGRQGLPPALGARFALNGPSVGCDVNGDGFSDVLVGVPFAFVRGVAAGGVVVLFGSASGLSRQRSLRITHPQQGGSSRLLEAGGNVRCTVRVTFRSFPGEIPNGLADR
jgi:hypothetical protein